MHVRMKSRTKNSIRALILLAVFSLNTVVGFACSLGIDMGFNSTHHNNEAGASIHIHKDGKPHTHSKQTVHNHGKHKHTGKHHSGSRPNKLSPDKSSVTKSGNNNCCTDDVVQFEKIDKSVPNSAITAHPLFVASFVYVFYDTILPNSDIVKNIRQFVRSYHPPIPNIRIAIQSFKI